MLSKRLAFSYQEKLYLLLTILVLSFILSFRDWGVNKFDFLLGIRNLVIAVLLVSLSLLVKLYVQKYFAHRVGFIVEFRPWLLGLLIGLIFVFVSNGTLTFLAIGGLTFYVIERLKVGRADIGGHGSPGWISIAGPITNLVLAAFFKVFTPVPLLEHIAVTAVSINLLIAFFGMLPIPFIEGFTFENLRKTRSSDGLQFLHSSLLEYLIVAISGLATGLAIWFSPPSYAIGTTLIFLVVVRGIYYIFYQQNIPQDRVRKAI